MKLSAVKEILFAFCFILFFSLSCHFLFSSLGFIPMDDGFFLAFSRRILDGQIPYKDFLYYANIGTPLLYVPFVKFGGDYVFWSTRYIFWFEFACISWIWTYLITKNFLPHKISAIYVFILASLAFLFNTHSYPPTIWYTIDGFFFYSVGLLLCLKENNSVKFIGYFLVGSTFLFKQNFIFLLPATIFLLKDWKSIRFWVALLLPSIFFYSFFLFIGAFGPLITQTTSRTEFVDTAIKGYVGKFTFPWGILVGFSGISLIYTTKLYKKIIGVSVLLIPIFYSFWYLHNASKFIFDASFFLLGSLIGIAVVFIKREKLSKNSVILLLGSITAWCLGISGGYIAPVFASGIIVVYLFTLLHYFVNTDKQLKTLLRPVLTIIIILLLPLAVYNYYYIRTYSVYQDSHTAKENIYKADAILPGGKNILVAKDTYEILQDLHKAIKIAKTKQKPYTILSYATALWVKSEDRNPLPIDYYFIYHTQKPFVEPLKEAIIQGKGKMIVIVNKSNLAEVADYSHYNSVYRFALLVPQYYTKFDETKYHVLFQ